MLSKRSSLLRIAILTVALSLTLTSSPTTSAEKSGGTWVPSGSGCSTPDSFSGCDADQVCADWDVDGEPLISCCIEPEFLSTSLFEACGG